MIFDDGKMSKKGGYYCAFKNCRGLSRRDKRSFFRFPKDPLRSKQWVKACDRTDLLEKTPIELFNSYRVCAKHFTDSMFLNDLRNRLQPNSVPMQLEPPDEAEDAVDADKRRDEFPDCQDSVAKILSNCILQKISADEFFKATGIRINEPVSAIKATEEYLQNSNPSDHIYSSTKANNAMNVTGNSLAIDIDNENPNNFSIEALSYQDLMNSLPMSLMSEPGTDTSSMETSELPFLISDKTLDLDKLPSNILDGQDAASSLNSLSNTFDSLKAMTQTNLNIFKSKLEETTQTDFNSIEHKLEKTSQTEFNFVVSKSEESTQTESIFMEKKLEETIQIDINSLRNKIENTSQTESSFLKDKLSKRKLKKVLQSKKLEIKELKGKIQQNIVSVMDNITLEQYEILTEKFFPKETADFIKIQAQLFKKKNNDRKYSLEFKKQCLSLFLAGPRTYKNLQKIFCLPGVRDLQTLKF